MAREIVLNATASGDRSLGRWRDLAQSINHVRDLEGDAYTDNRTKPERAFTELHRYAQQQFQWHPSHRGVNPMTRYLKVFGVEEVNKIIQRETGMTMHQFVQLGLAVTGHFFRTNWMSVNQQYGYLLALGISAEASEAFFRRITCSIDELRADTLAQQSYDADWLFTWNPLAARPLVRFDPSHPDRVLCPIPRYLVRRTQGGIFFDLVNKSGFDHPFGSAFQSYTGDVLAITCPAPRFISTPEETFHLGKEELHGVDWILSDATGNLFIENKTKRLTLNARVRFDTAALEKDLAVMAEAIVQNYKNILLALQGKTKWVPNGLPIYPLILTLEDWFLFGPTAQSSLKEALIAQIRRHGVPEEVLETMPYTIASASEFEILTQIIAQTNIFKVMSEKTCPEQREWSWMPIIFAKFKEEMQSVNLRLFPNEFAALMPVGSFTAEPD